MKTKDIAALMVTELDKANKKHSQFTSPHQGYAVILEELDELWDEVKKKHPDKQRMLEEVIQVGAMAMKFVQMLKGQEGYQDDTEKIVELERKCRQCQYKVLNYEEFKKLGGDPCNKCLNSSEWEPKEEQRD
jgi:NTP pyrophosphatase (non-canonical NTP hydrolase)